MTLAEELQEILRDPDEVLNFIINGLQKVQSSAKFFVKEVPSGKSRKLLSLIDQAIKAGSAARG